MNNIQIDSLQDLLVLLMIVKMHHQEMRDRKWSGHRKKLKKK